MPSTEQVIAESMAAVVLAATEPLMRRIADLEQRMTSVRDGKDGQPGRDGRDGAQGRDGKDGIDGKDGAQGMSGKDGAPGIAGKDGRDGVDGKDGAVGLSGKDGSDGLNGKDGAPGKDGRDGVDGLHGKDGAIGPAGKDGIDGKPGLNGKDGAQGIAGKDGRDGIDGKDGTPGAKGDPGQSVTGGIVDKTGNLILTFSDGTVKEVGVVVGKDGTNGIDGVGRDGKDAAPVDMLAVKSIVLEAAAQIPKPKDGKDGRDGFGFEDLEVISRGPRGVTFKFTRGDLVKSFDWDAPIPIYQGVFETGKSYEAGDIVTRQGSMWFCHTPTSDLPGEGAKSWQLCVKRGSPGQKGEQGLKGVSVTRDLTQMDPNTGAKW